MSDELQAEIDRLKAANDKLTRDLTGALDDLKEVRGEARDRRHENKALVQQVAELTAQRDEFKGKAEADPEDLRKAIDGQRSMIRDLKHERAYDKVARELKVSNPVKFADLLKVAGYTPEADDPDESKIAATFREALQGRPWLVDAETNPEPRGSTTAPGGAGATTPAQPAVPGPGSDRGQTVQSTSSQPPSKPAGRL